MSSMDLKFLVVLAFSSVGGAVVGGAILCAAVQVAVRVRLPLKKAIALNLATSLASFAASFAASLVLFASPPGLGFGDEIPPLGPELLGVGVGLFVGALIYGSSIRRPAASPSQEVGRTARRRFLRTRPIGFGRGLGVVAMQSLIALPLYLLFFLFFLVR